MKGVIAIDDARAPRSAACEFQGGLDGLRPGVRKENLVEKRNKTKQAFGKQTGENGHVHLDEIGQIARKDTVQCFASPCAARAHARGGHGASTHRRHPLPRHP